MFISGIGKSLTESILFFPTFEKDTGKKTSAMSRIVPRCFGARRDCVSTVLYHPSVVFPSRHRHP